jgi:rhodanese-related sulfurtransferase
VLLLAGAFFLQSNGALRKGHDDFQINEVSAAQAKVLIDAGALVIDVRDVAVATAKHIPGALFIPLEALPARIPALEAATTQPIVVYCGDGSTLGPRAAEMLNKAGYTQAVNLKSGLSGWQDAGLPTKSG